MKSLNLEHYGVCSIINEELTEINGGHEGTAYKIGHAVGEFVEVVGAVGGAVAFILLFRD